MYTTKIKMLRQLIVDTAIILIGSEGHSPLKEGTIQHNQELWELESVSVVKAEPSSYLIISVKQENKSRKFKLLSEIVSIEALGTIADILFEMKQEHLNLDKKIDLTKRALRETYED